MLFKLCYYLFDFFWLDIKFISLSKLVVFEMNFWWFLVKLWVIYFIYVVINIIFFFKNCELWSICYFWFWEGVLFIVNLFLYKDCFLVSLSGFCFFICVRMFLMFILLKLWLIFVDFIWVIGKKKD